MAGLAFDFVVERASFCRSAVVGLRTLASFMPPLLGLGVRYGMAGYKHSAPLALKGSGGDLGMRVGGGVCGWCRVCGRSGDQSSVFAARDPANT